MSDLVWEPPDKGEWRGLHDHFPRALTPIYRDLLRAGMEAGEREWFETYGLPVRTISARFVHGRVFIAPEPLVGRPSDRTPPTWAVRLAVRVLPPFRRRAAAAEVALRERRWLAEARDWYETTRPRVVARNRALDEVDVALLADDELIDHLRAARDNAAAGYLDHFRLHGTDLMPTGMLLGRAADWGLDPVGVAGLLAGSSPASRGGSTLPAWRVVTGYDLDDRCAAELPARAGRPPEVSPPEAHAVEEAAFRARVPAADRPEWDRLLADARTTYGVRDDNGLLTAAWPVGLLRRALLEAGRRLVDRGRLEVLDDVVELTLDEVDDALGGADLRATASERALVRRRLSTSTAPAVLGPAVDVPTDALPPAMRTMARALYAIRELGTTQVGARSPLVGIGIGAAAVVGRACVARDPAEALARFEPGDILVTAGTTPAWNTVLAEAGGVVTEEGGPLSHAAIIARELGLPALVGTADAVALIDDGATIELDPVAGVVRIL